MSTYSQLGHSQRYTEDGICRFRYQSWALLFIPLLTLLFVLSHAVSVKAAPSIAIFSSAPNTFQHVHFKANASISFAPSLLPVMAMEVGSTTVDSTFLSGEPAAVRASLLVTAMVEPPTFRLVSQEWASGEIKLSGSAVSGSAVQITVDAQPLITAAVTYEGGWSTAFTVTDSGDHLLTVDALAADGSVLASSAPITLTILALPTVTPEGVTAESQPADDAALIEVITPTAVAEVALAAPPDDKTTAFLEVITPTAVAEVSAALSADVTKTLTLFVPAFAMNAGTIPLSGAAEAGSTVQDRKSVV